MGINLHHHLNRITRSLAITSGKGGVGKTTLTCNIAYHLGELGHRVLIFDGDMGMANVDIMFGVRPKRDIGDVLLGRAALASVLVQVAPNVSLVPGGSGVVELQNLNNFERRALLDEVSHLDSCYDYLLIDTAPGISDNVLCLNMAAQDSLIVLTPEPASFADSYALIKVLNQQHRKNHFSLICNRVEGEKEGLAVYKRFNDVVMKFLDVGIDYWGAIPEDLNLRHAVHSQRLVLRQAPEAEAGLAIRRIVSNLATIPAIQESRGGMEFFWEQLVGAV